MVGGPNSGQNAPEEQIRVAIQALQQGDYSRAAAILREVATILPEAAMPWEFLAKAEESLGNLEASVAALDRRLALDSRNVGALLVKGSLLERMGDQRAASSYYSTALAQHAADGSCPPQLMPLLRHAEQANAGTSNQFREHLLESVGEGESPRVRHAIELLTGKKEVFLQQPSMFYFPELPQRQFYDIAQFEWLEPMLALLPQMQAELLEVEQRSNGRFTPYVERPENRPAPNNPLLDDPSWGAHWFWRFGEIVDENARDCPATMKALEYAPMPMIADRSPMALWSRLTPGTHIQPHHGMLNTRLICHIPIKTAPDCFLRVGNERRTWEDGIPLVFDDSFEHEAKNGGDQIRVVLLFEIWRPEINQEERAELTKLFETIDLYSGE